MTQIQLSDVISVGGRFHRSINLPRDWRAHTDLSDYIVTPTIRQLAERILSEAGRKRGTRSWSITGPYGSGKSAFALFLADLFAAEEPSHKTARDLSNEAGFPIQPLIPVLLVAERQPLGSVLKSALAEALEELSPDLAARVRRSRASTGSSIAGLFTEIAESVDELGYGGLLLVVDELGKFLEFAATDPTKGDVFILQQLAEAVERSDAPMVFITILHRGFADYLRMGDELQRAEWQKVQGRFRDMPFQLPAEQALALVGHALDGDGVPRELSDAWSEELDEQLDSEALAEAEKRVPLRLLEHCVPLHPVSTLLLWPLFRSKAAQNERSLFAFLTSAEPFGFQDFLTTTWKEGDDAPFYRPADLFDYVASALGLAAFTGDHARKWSVIEHAVHRIPADAPELHQQVVKTIGLLSLYGPPVGLAPSRATLELALGTDLGEALTFLEERSLVVFRKHANGYALWEGSDVNLDAAFEEAQAHVGSGDVVGRLTRLLELRPVVARAHYVESGTLRFLDVEVVAADREVLEETLRRPTKADGRVVYAIVTSDGDVDSAVELAKEVTEGLEDPLRIVAVPSTFQGIEVALRELEAWTWVSRNVTALQGDSVARQEVRARTAAARDRLELLAGRLFGLAGSPFEPNESVWVFEGEVQDLSSALQFQRWISARCEETFPKAPRLHNELLNRQSLSSAATAARRNLLERMVEAPTVERLGIEGTPAEASMYESMLRVGGFHRKRNGTWEIGRPKGEWRFAWNAAVRFIGSAKDARRSFAELIERLGQPPYGIREGPLPVLLWALLLAKRDEIALYEEGVFVPELRVEVMERLVRRPETFELQSQKLDSHHAAALRGLRDVLQVENEQAGYVSEADFLPVVKSLILFASRLTPFARRTRRLSPPEAVTVREELLGAQDPHALLFDDLPSALGIDLLSDEGPRSFGHRLRECLESLGRAYPALLDEIERQIRHVFSLEGTAVEARRKLAARAAPLVDFAVDGRLRLFVREAAADRSDRDWRESLARVLQEGMPPSHWSDRDVSVFQVRLTEVSSEFARLEELVAEKKISGANRILRIGILDGSHRERRAVIPVETVAAEEVIALAGKVRDALGGNGENGSSRVRLAALAQVAAGLLEEGGEEDGG